MSTRFVLATVGTTGDVRPFATLAAALRAAGHDVRAISWELHREQFEAAGAEFVAAGPATTWHEIADVARQAADARSPLDQVAILRDFHLRDAVPHYRALREALPGGDVVVLHGIHSLGEAAARDAGLRWATAVFDPVLLPTGTRPPPGLPPLGPLNGAAWWLLDRMLGRLNGPLDSALWEAGSPSAGSISLFRGRSSLLHLVACSPAIAGLPSDLPESVRFTGAWAPPTEPDALPAEVEAFLATGGPPAFVTFGSMAFSDAQRLSQVVVEGLRHAGLRGIVQSGAAGLRPQAPSAVVLSVGELDHRALLPRVAVAVHHGGAGTTHTVTSAGIPSVVVPHIGDQVFWADRLRRFGAAPRPIPPSKLTGATLGERMREAATSAALRAGSTRLAELVRAEDGLAASVRMLEEAAAAAR
jgi:UDP:flavonoid glycosyltransferase YjiC (YdhE family)